MTNKTIIMNQQDIRISVHPNLWYDWLETLGIDSEATEVCLEVSPLDENKRILSKDEKLEKIAGYIKEKTKLFGNSEDERGKAIIEVLTNIGYFLE